MSQGNPVGFLVVDHSDGQGNGDARQIPSLRQKNGCAQDDAATHLGYSQFAPNIFEIVEAFLAGDPLGGADGTFGEAAAREGVVTEVN